MAQKLDVLMNYQGWVVERQRLLERIKELEAENKELKKRLGEEDMSLDPHKVSDLLNGHTPQLPVGQLLPSGIFMAAVKRLLSASWKLLAIVRNFRTAARNFKTCR